MAFIGGKWAVPTTALVILLCGPSLAEDTINGALPSAHLQSKVAYCKTCHGLSGEGYRGYYPMPRLAGQQTDYLESQLRDFAEGRRLSPLMFNVARVLNPSMRSELAAHFRDLNPKPIGGAPRELMTIGKEIYEEGISDAGIAPCSSCHGSDAKGDGAFPRLAGQLYEYIVKRFETWRKERQASLVNPDTSVIMESIAQNLSESQIAAVAAYLSNLE
jgi:cytochrome c553